MHSTYYLLGLLGLRHLLRLLLWRRLLRLRHLLWLLLLLRGLLLLLRGLLLLLRGLLLLLRLLLRHLLLRGLGWRCRRLLRAPRPSRHGDLDALGASQASAIAGAEARLLRLLARLQQLRRGLPAEDGAAGIRRDGRGDGGARRARHQRDCDGVVLMQP